MDGYPPRNRPENAVPVSCAGVLVMAGRECAGCRRPQSEKLVPQPQEEEAFGFSMVNRAPINASEKSITAEDRKGRETLSTSTRDPSFSITRSSAVASSSRMSY